MKKIVFYAIINFLLLNKSLIYSSHEQRLLDQELLSECLKDDIDNTKIEDLLELGANSNSQDANLNTPLHNLVNSKCLFRLKPLLLLIKNNSDINIENSNGNTPLIDAIKNQDFFMIQVFYELCILNLAERLKALEEIVKIDIQESIELIEIFNKLYLNNESRDIIKHLKKNKSIITEKKSSSVIEKLAYIGIIISIITVLLEHMQKQPGEQTFY